MAIRSFLAVTIPQKTINQLGDLVATLSYQDKTNTLRWVQEDNYHVTLAFLGNQDMDTLQALAYELDEVIPLNGFNLKISRLSPFPESKPKLITALIEANSQLNELQKTCSHIVNKCGIVLEKKRYLPHITLGRFRHRKNQYLGTITGQIDIHFQAEEVVLFESILTPNGAEYDPIYRFPMDELGLHHT